MSISPHKYLIVSCAVASLAIAASSVPAQTAPAGAVQPAQAADPPSSAAVIPGLRIALAQVTGAISNLDVERWKVPGDVRESTQGDVASMQRDLTATLPPLLDEASAEGAPSPLAPAFAVFRNVDALYDVLLRVSQIAGLARASDANGLENARAALEAARAQLGASLLQSIAAQDAQVVHLRAAAQPVPAPSPPPPPAKIVVDDGPAPKHHKKKPVPAPAPQ